MSENLVCEPRPSLHSPEIAGETAKSLLKQVLAWFSSAGCENADSEEDKAEILEQLTEAISDSMFYGLDGYQIAKSLDDHSHWDVDSALVEICDNAFHHASGAVSKLTKAWKEKNNIVARFKVGDKVVVKRKHKDDVQGEIVTVYDDDAKYSVFCESLGHIRGGEGKCGTLGTIAFFEDVFPIPE